MSSPARQLRAPLLWLLVPFMAGLAAAHLLPAPRAAVMALLPTAGVAAAVALRAAARDQRWRWSAAILGAMGAAGFAYLNLSVPHLHEWSDRPPREVTLTLEVTQLFSAGPQSRSTGGLAVVVGAGPGDAPLRRARVYLSVIRRLGPELRRGGTYRVQGVLEPLAPGPNSGGFDDYLANCGVRHRLLRARVQAELHPPGALDRASAAVNRHLQSLLRRGLEQHPDQRSLYLAILLGEKAVLSTSQQNAFVRSGTFHIFSVSGLHVGVIATALMVLTRWLRLPGRIGTVLSVSVLWAYVQITGASSPAQRAFLMIAFLLASQTFRLPGNPLAALTASALATLLLDPLQLFSTGFQMSYAVVAALILMGVPLAERWLARWRPFALLPRHDWGRHHQAIEAGGRWAIGSLAGCWAAFLASVPAGIGFFGLFSPVSLLANLAAIPLSSGIIYLGFASLVAGAVGLGPVSIGFNLAAAALVQVTDRLAGQLAGWPGGFIAAHFRCDWLASLSLAVMTGAMLLGASARWSGSRGGFWLPVLVLAGLMIFGVIFD